MESEIIPTKKIALNTIILGLSRGFVFITGAINVIVTAGALGVNGYANFATIFSILGMLAILNEFGLDPLYVSFVGKASEKERLNLLWQFVWLRLFLGVLFVLVVIMVSLFLPFNRFIRLGLILASPIYIFTYLSSIIASFFQVKLVVAPSSVMEVIGRFFATFILVTFSLFSFLSLNTAIASHVMGNGVIFLGMMFFLLWSLSEMGIGNIRPDIKLMTKIIKKALPLALVAFLNQVFFRIDIPMLSNMAGGQQTGLYAFSYKIFELSAYPATFLTISFYPLLTSLQKSKHFQLALRKSTAVLVLVAVVVSFGVNFFFPLVTSLHPQLMRYAGARVIVLILFLSLPFLYLQTLYSLLFILKGWQKKLTVIYALAVVLNVSLNFFFIPVYGAMASAVITFLTQAIIGLILVWNYRFDLLANLRFSF